MKIVIDTNIVISAILKDRDPEIVILFVAGHPDFQWIASVDIVEEYVNVLKRPKFKLPTGIVRKWDNRGRRGRSRFRDRLKCEGLFGEQNRHSQSALELHNNTAIVMLTGKKIDERIANGNSRIRQ